MRCEQFLRIPVELNPALLKHHELGMRSPHVVETHNLDSSVLAHGPVRRDVERVANLMGHDDRRGMLQVPST